MGDVIRCIICEEDDRIVGVRQRFGGNIFECQRCGLQFLLPQPDDARLNTIYEKEYFETWGITNQEPIVRELKMKTFRLRFKVIESELKSGDKILDCGCATGYLLEAGKEAGYEPFGVDLSEFAAKESIRKFGGSRIYCGQLEHAQFEDNPSKIFSALFLMDYIEHVRNPKDVLKLAASMLKENGSIVISTPKLNSMSHRLMGKGWSHYKEEHLFYFSFEAMKKILEESGFTEIGEHPPYKYLSLDYIKGHFNVYPHSFFTPVINLIWKILPASFCNRPFPIQLGDLVVTGKKASRN